MAEKVRDIMTPNPVMLAKTATAAEAAKLMREQDIGDVLVTDDGRIHGIVTDRDIIVRVVAQGREPAAIALDEIASKDDLVVVAPEDDAVAAVKRMRDRAIRRLVVAEGGAPVGVVSIGDLAEARDPESALADISAAKPNV